MIGKFSASGQIDEKLSAEKNQSLG